MADRSSPAYAAWMADGTRSERPWRIVKGKRLELSTYFDACPQKRQVVARPRTNVAMASPGETLRHGGWRLHFAASAD